MSITDFGDKSKDEIIEYLIDEHNSTEREKPSGACRSQGDHRRV